MADDVIINQGIRKWTAGSDSGPAVMRDTTLRRRRNIDPKPEFFRYQESETSIVNAKVPAMLDHIRGHAVNA